MMVTVSPLNSGATASPPPPTLTSEVITIFSSTHFLPTQKSPPTTNVKKNGTAKSVMDAGVAKEKTWKKGHALKAVKQKHWKN